jgi:hypothetical protein
MALPKKQTEERPTTLSPEEGRAFFDREARRVLGISGDEFLARLDAGEYDDIPDTPEGWPILRLSMLISFGRC